MKKLINTFAGEYQKPATEILEADTLSVICDSLVSSSTEDYSREEFEW